MRINDKVYRYSKGEIVTGVIVAKKWQWSSWLPTRQYIVKDISNPSGIADIISTAFFGKMTELHRCDVFDLIPMPKVVNGDATLTWADKPIDSQ